VTSKIIPIGDELDVSLPNTPQLGSLSNHGDMLAASPDPFYNRQIRSFKGNVSKSASIAPSAKIWDYVQIRDNAKIGKNVIIGRGAYIGTGVIVADNCKIQNYALLYEPATLEQGVFVGPSVVFTNDRYPRAVNPDLKLNSKRIP
jgi:NDP-sugar pyrophosphorylase family protein